MRLTPDTGQNCGLNGQPGPMPAQATDGKAQSKSSFHSSVMLNVTGKGLGVFFFFLGIDKLSGILKVYADSLSAYSVHVVKPASMPRFNAYKEN